MEPTSVFFFNDDDRQGVPFDQHPFCRICILIKIHYIVQHCVLRRATGDLP